MPTVQLCDGGCGTVEGNGVSFRELGKIRTKRYCLHCSFAVLTTVNDIDELHTSLAKDWVEGVGSIRGEFYEEHPNAVLPDE